MKQTWYQRNTAESKKRSRAYYKKNRVRCIAWTHYDRAHNEKNKQFKNYHNMEFFKDWDTAKDTSKARSEFGANAAKWINENMPRPDGDWDLHVDKTIEHPHGFFGPGGIRWLPNSDIHHQFELAAALAVVEKHGYEVKYIKNLK